MTPEENLASLQRIIKDAESFLLRCDGYRQAYSVSSDIDLSIDYLSAAIGAAKKARPEKMLIAAAGIIAAIDKINRTLNIKLSALTK